MRILITGAFGNVGKAVLHEAQKNNHEIVVFELDTKRNRKLAKKYRNMVDTVIFGDIRDYISVLSAVEGCDGVIHMAAIIPPVTKRNRELCMAVNYGGTVNVVNALNQVDSNIPLIFCSSASVMGATQHLNRLIRPDDPLKITGNYEESKIKAENMIREKYSNFLIFRLAGVLPIHSDFSFQQLEELFSIHSDARVEMILDLDVAFALITAVEKLATKETPNNRAYMLGGGKKNGFQITGEILISRSLGCLSLPKPDPKYFTQDLNSYHLDWYDTEAAQQEFAYQNHKLDDYYDFVQKRYGRYRIFIRLFRSLILRKFISMSPYYKNPAA